MLGADNQYESGKFGTRSIIIGSKGNIEGWVIEPNVLKKNEPGKINLP